ncbi:MAG TPA: hypothetical protein VNN62_03310 [Methylomirabilota bacterium]|jgi:hypothetical protein|nr:hypothetical protein [Methylomirabilota bacterium]
MKLSVAYHCQECQEIFERAPRRVCPQCASRDISLLSWLVKSAAEREAWVERISGGTRRAPAFRPALRYSCPTLVNTIEPEAA